MFYFITGLLIGLLFQKSDFETIKKHCSDLLSLYNSLYEKQSQLELSDNQVRRLFQTHFNTCIQVVMFIGLTLFENVKQHFKTKPVIVNLATPNKVLYAFQVHNKTKYIPVSSTKLQVPDVINISYEQFDETVSKEWLTNNLFSIVSVYPDYKQITPKDLGLKHLCLEVLDGVDIKTFKFEEDDHIKVM